jgi:hypothetical protein
VSTGSIMAAEDDVEAELNSIQEDW